jgi:hypothetical protein
MTPPNDLETTRRRFLAYFSSIGLTSTLLPGALWAEMQQQNAQRISPEMLKMAMTLTGLEYSDDERQDADRPESESRTL